jgi:hypothetical protein
MVNSFNMICWAKILRSKRMYEWFFFALFWLIMWAVVYAAKASLRQEMLQVSAFATLGGLTEPIFVPAYWNPPSLFNLTQTTHFDIESFMFSFATGGIAAVLYEAILNLKHRKLTAEDRRGSGRRWFHFASVLSTPFVLAALLIFTSMNPIYSVIIALFAGGVAAVVCRPDLAKNTFAGGLLFAGLYFLFFSLVVAISPSFINAWNLSALSGIIVMHLPLEELGFAFGFGMLYSGLYEHTQGYKFV